MKLESLLQYIDKYLAVEGHPDDPRAVNGLQVEGREDVGHVVAAVDASEASIVEAISRGAHLVIVHHGLFWGGAAPLTGRLLRRVQPLITGGVSLYSCHLPLDTHAEVGNAALLGQALGLSLEGRFGYFDGVQVGWQGRLGRAVDPPTLLALVSAAVGGEVRLIEGGGRRVERIGVVTGAGAGALEEASRLGLDALVTGECDHHHYFDATELGIHLVLAGHYATEIFGVKALAAHVAERFGLTWEFVDKPTGL